jgi:hypothetical protein
VVIILLSFLFIDLIGSNVLFFVVLVSGFLLAGIPANILKWQSKNVAIQGNENKSIFAFSIFTKTLKD